MSQRQTTFTNLEYYHIYNRGNDKRVIFHDEQDYYYFLNLLSVMNTEKRLRSKTKRDINNYSNGNIVSIGAYVLMPNHFHLLLRQEKDAGISTFLQKISTAYAMYYNKKYKRTGSLFEGKFKAKTCIDDRYLKYLFSYIHLNPLKILDKNWKSKVKNISNELFNYLCKYPYSSFNEYYTGEEIIIRRESFPEYFSTKKSFIKEIKAWFFIEN